MERTYDITVSCRQNQSLLAATHYYRGPVLSPFNLGGGPGICPFGPLISCFLRSLLQRVIQTAAAARSSSAQKRATQATAASGVSLINCNGTHCQPSNSVTPQRGPVALDGDAPWTPRMTYSFLFWQLPRGNCNDKDGHTGTIRPFIVSRLAVETANGQNALEISSRPQSPAPTCPRPPPRPPPGCHFITTGNLQLVSLCPYLPAPSSLHLKYPSSSSQSSCCPHGSEASIILFSPPQPLTRTERQ